MIDIDNDLLRVDLGYGVPDLGNLLVRSTVAQEKEHITEWNGQNYAAICKAEFAPPEYQISSNSRC